LIEDYKGDSLIALWAFDQMTPVVFVQIWASVDPAAALVNVVLTALGSL
jgi:hypothetical protein